MVLRRDGNVDHPEHGGTSAADRRSVLFVCRHGAAKSVLAAADFRTLATKRGLDIGAVAAGLDPDPNVAAVLIATLPSRSLGTYSPRAVTADDLASAARVITFNLAPEELLVSGTSVERWDDVPSVSEDLEAARDAIRRHLDILLDDYQAAGG